MSVFLFRVTDWATTSRAFVGAWALACAPLKKGKDMSKENEPKKIGIDLQGGSSTMIGNTIKGGDIGIRISGTPKGTTAPAPTTITGHNIDLSESDQATKNWYQKPIGMVAIGVLTAVIASALVGVVSVVF